MWSCNFCMCSSLPPSLHWDVQVQHWTNHHLPQSTPSSCLFLSQARGWRHLPSVKKRGLVSELIVRMGDSPAVRDRATWETRLFQLLVRPRGNNMGNSERWLEGHVSTGSQGRGWMLLQWCFVLLWSAVVDKGPGLFYSLAEGLRYCHWILSAAASYQKV